MDFTTNILLSIIVFLGIVLLLVALLLWVRNKLMPKGEVKITINDDKVLTVPTGNTLIATLAEQKVYLPSACGGKGSCGQCKCRVVEGGGTILPTEVGFFTRKQIQDHWRLGCQVKAAVDSEREGIRMHGGQQPQRGHFYQGVQGAAACR